MLDTFRQLLTHQYKAVLCMLGACIDRCPESAWDGSALPAAPSIPV